MDRFERPQLPLGPFPSGCGAAEKFRIFDLLIGVWMECHKLLDPLEDNLASNGVTDIG
jgi:hypothetical protein